MVSLYLNFNIDTVPDEDLKSAFVGIFIQIKVTEFSKDKNVIIDELNEKALEVLTKELDIRDISVTKLMDKAFYFIKINKLLEK